MVDILSHIRRVYITSTSYESFWLRKEKGQVLIVVVLLMVIILTIGLSLATRSLMNVRQSAEEDSSQQAFSAAEAGINVALLKSATGEFTEPKLTENASFSTNIRNISGTILALNSGKKVLKNESVDIWLSDYPSYANGWSGNLIIHYGEEGDQRCDTPAFEVALLSGTSTTPSLTHYAFDNCNTRNNSNKFLDPDVNSIFETIEGIKYKFAITIPIPASSPGILMRIIPLYHDSRLAITSNAGARPFPIQGRVIESVGKSGETQRKIVVVQGNPKLPLEIFPYTLYTPSPL